MNQNGEWSEFFKDCKPAREISNKLLVVNKEQTVSASTKNNETNDNDVDEMV